MNATVSAWLRGRSRTACLASARDKGGSGARTACFTSRSFMALIRSWPKRIPLHRQYSLARTSTSSHIGTRGLLMGKVPRRRVAGLGGRVRSVQYDDDLNDQFVHRLAEIVVIEEQAVEDWLTGDFAGSS